MSVFLFIPLEWPIALSLTLFLIAHRKKKKKKKNKLEIEVSVWKARRPDRTRNGSCRPSTIEAAVFALWAS